MRIYTVKQPFMARKGQFGPNHALCIGIEQNALRTFGEYRCFIGKNKNDYYDITYEQAVDVVTKYGANNVLWHFKGKSTFIIPIKEMRHGQKKEAEKTS